MLYDKFKKVIEESPNILNCATLYDQPVRSCILAMWYSIIKSCKVIQCANKHYINPAKKDDTINA